MSAEQQLAADVLKEAMAAAEAKHATITAALKRKLADSLAESFEAQMSKMNDDAKYEEALQLHKDTLRQLKQQHEAEKQEWQQRGESQKAVETAALNNTAAAQVALLQEEIKQRDEALAVKDAASKAAAAEAAQFCNTAAAQVSLLQEEIKQRDDALAVKDAASKAAAAAASSSSNAAAAQVALLQKEINQWDEALAVREAAAAEASSSSNAAAAQVALLQKEIKQRDEALVVKEAASRAAITKASARESELLQALFTDCNRSTVLEPKLHTASTVPATPDSETELHAAMRRRDRMRQVRDATSAVALQMGGTERLQSFEETRQRLEKLAHPKIFGNTSTCNG